MSSKLVRKLLQATADAPTVEAAAAAVLQKKKRKRKLDETPIVASEDLVKHHILSLVGLDRHMVAGKQKVVKKKKQSTKQPKQLANVAKMHVGNSRSSSSGLQNQPLQPTFDKRRYKKEQKQETLRKIAKMLKKAKKKQSSTV
jgi:uncharacterized protein (UPF0254 family)